MSGTEGTLSVAWRGPDGVELRAQVHGAALTAAPAVFLPSLGLRQDWSFYGYFLRRLGEERPTLWIDLPPDALPSAELGAVKSLLASLYAGALPLRPGPVGLVGHGKGAALAILAAARAPQAGAVVALAPVSTFARAAREVPASFAADLAQHPELFHLEAAARGLRVPIVVAAGEEDDVAPIEEAEVLYHWLPKEQASFVVLEKTGHSLGAHHPFQGSNRELDRCVAIAREFFGRYLPAPAG